MEQNNYFETKIKELVQLKATVVNLKKELDKITKQGSDIDMPVFENMQDVEEFNLNEQRRQMVISDMKKSREQITKDIAQFEKDIIQAFPITLAWVRIYDNVYAAIQTSDWPGSERTLKIAETNDRTSLPVLHKQIIN